MGEEFILFAAVLGVAILRASATRPSSRRTRTPPTATPCYLNAVRVVGLALVGPVVLFGIYVVAHGHLSPGAGSRAGSSWPPAPCSSTCPAST